MPNRIQREFRGLCFTEIAYALYLGVAQYGAPQDCLRVVFLFWGCSQLLFRCELRDFHHIPNMTPCWKQRHVNVKAWCLRFQFRISLRYIAELLQDCFL